MAYSVVRARPNPRKRRGDNDEVDWEEEMPKRGAYEAAVMGDTPDVPSASTGGGEGDAQEGSTSTTAFPPRDFGWNASYAPSKTGPVFVMFFFFFCFYFFFSHDC